MNYQGEDLQPFCHLYNLTWYNERHRRSADHMTEQPWSFGAHHWAGSWLTPEQRSAQDRKARR